MPDANINSTSAVSCFLREMVEFRAALCRRTERSRDFTVDRPTVRGKDIPTLISLLIPARGLTSEFTCRSYAANIDFTVANLRRTVRGRTASMLPSHRLTRSRLTEDIGVSLEIPFAKVRIWSRSCRYALRVCGLSFRWSLQWDKNHSIKELSVCTSKC